MLRGVNLDLVGDSTYTHSLPDVQMTVNIVIKLIPMQRSFWVDHTVQCFLTTPFSLLESMPL